MAFRFSLAPLHRLRQSVERQRTLQLQEASLRVAQVRETLAQLEGFLAEAAIRDAEHMADGATSAELEFASVYRENLARYGDELRAEIDRLEKVRQLALAEYRHAYREREILDAMKARQRRDYQQEQLRRQQQELDAAHLLGRWFRRD